MQGGASALWIERFSPPPAGAGAPTVAVKDLIDVEGSVTTAGCLAVARRGHPAGRDAACITAVRAAGGRLAGKVNLHELAFGVSGVNPWYGTPENPADPGRVPGGSSSGSAVAVAIGEADVALGSDTGGSVRIPAACCGVVGLKTTHGRLSTEGVWPLAPSYDTVGPLARDVEGVVLAMGLLEAGFAPAGPSSLEGARIGRVRPLAGAGAPVEVDPVIDRAVDEALGLSELEVEEVPLPGWREAWRAQQLLLGVEALESDGWLLAETGGDGIGAGTLERFERSPAAEEEVAAARRVSERFAETLGGLFSRFAALALPTLPRRPPPCSEPVRGFNALTAPVNLVGLPALSLPVPAAARPPTGLQLVGPAGGEELLVALGAVLESAVGR